MNLRTKRFLSLFLTVMMVMSSWVFAVPAAAAGTGSDNTGSSSSVDLNDRLELNFNKNWKFHLGDVSNAQSQSFSDTGWTDVNLPHDFSIIQQFTSSGEVESGNLPGGTGWYRKTFTVPANLSSKTIVLNFDGSYNFTEVFVNGVKIGDNRYGYNAFSFDISEKLVRDGTSPNLIAIKVTHDLPSSRWYSGSGLFRDVTLTITNPVHVSLYGTQVKMPYLKNTSGTNGNLDTAVTVQNDSSAQKNIKIKNTLYNPTNTVVSTSTEYPVSIPAGQSRTVYVANTYENPYLWSTDRPNLYTLKTEILDESDNVLDTYNTTIGYRWFDWNSNNGFSLNGKNMKIQGVCMHHDQGALGSVQEFDAIYRQMSILKDMGVNAVRTSHNSTSRVLLDVCNHLGLIVMEEFFDGWNARKNYNYNDFAKYFNTYMSADNTVLGGSTSTRWYEFVITQTMKRDRNDPSIVIWSMGNELNEGCFEGSVDPSFGGPIRDLIRSLDDRPITHGNNKSTMAVDQYADVIGGNYHLGDYWGNKSNAGGKPFVGSETASAVNSRGEYNATGSGGNGVQYVNDGLKTINSYDNSWVGWGNSATEAWDTAIKNDWFSGEFVWTGFDYIGEPTPWNNTGSGALIPVSSYFGIIDTAGFGKDSYYLYRSWWNQDKTLHLVPSTWNRNSLTLNGGYVNVAVYSNADHIKLYLNDQEIGSAQSTTVTTNAGHKYQTWSETSSNNSKCRTNEFYGGNGHELYAQFQVRHETGNLSVRAFDAQGNDITGQCDGIKKAVSNNASKIVAKTWGNVHYSADGDSYAYIEYEAQDNDNNFINDYNGTININVSGEGLIAGVDNGHGGTIDKFQQPQVLNADRKSANIQMFNGRALAIVKTTEVPDTINITTTTNDGVPVNGVSVTSAPEEGYELTDEYEEVFGADAPEYVPTTQDRYNEIKNKIDNLSGGIGDGKYVRFPVQMTQGGGTQITRADSITSGVEYIITGHDDVSGNCSKGVMTGKKYDTYNLRTDGSASVSESSFRWTFEANGSGYNIFFTDANGNRSYLDSYNSGSRWRPRYNLRLGNNPYRWNVTRNSDNTFKISDDNGNFINYSGDYEGINKVGFYQEGTPLTLYTVSTGSSVPDIPDGNYVIYNYPGGNYSKFIIGDDLRSVDVSGNLYENETKLATDAINEFTFTNVGGNRYTIRNASGYLTMNGNDLTFSNTPMEFEIYVRSDGRITIGNGGKLIDHYKDYNPPEFNAWPSEANTGEANRIMTLYKAPEGGGTVDPAKQGLYNALKDGAMYPPGDHSKASYDRLLDALNNGYDVYNRAGASTEEINNAEQEIRNAINGLATAIKKFSSTLFKYGYNNTSGKNYYDGGKHINNVAINELKAAIRANGSLMSQIKNLIGYDTQSWRSQAEKDNALETVISAYAKIYVIQFTNDPVTNSNSAVSLHIDPKTNPVEINSNTYLPTLWNQWSKTGTTDTAAGEAGEEGASLQGLAGAKIGPGNTLTSHEPYGDALKYGNESVRTGSSMNDIYYINIVKNGSTQRVSLNPLSGISPYFTDLFGKKALTYDGTVTDATSGNFAKYYWDTEFPFLMTTDKNGINTYKYDSADSNFIIQASYDDTARTADMNLNKTTTDWNVNRASKDPGKGFFPFNYQDNKTNLMGENAIYHFGMTFTTNFTIPAGGHYKGSNQDIVFNFSGDDDVYVYIDDTLVLDNGGLHGARAASINFTQKSVSYQYAADVTEGVVKSQTPNSVTYKYGETNTGISSDNQAALDKLNSILTGGEEHTFTFFYLERGSTDSNCKIEFNLQESSNDIRLEGQSLVLDYGLPVEYDIKSNNRISDAAVRNGAVVEYLGVGKVNQPITDVIVKDQPELFRSFTGTGDAASDIITLTKDSGLPEGITMRGVFTIDRDGNISYEINDMNFTASDTIFVVARVTNDPTYERGMVYYQYERITFVPATNIYYEDNFKQGSVITYTDGQGSTKYGKWTVSGTAAENMKQAADLVGDPAANVYGHDPVYENSNTFSGGGAHYVEVSAANNPAKQSGSSWPKAKFTFTGTAFDVTSLTNNKTGVVEVKVYNGGDTQGQPVKDYVVDTYYGYNYGQLYADENGNPTHNASGTVPVYKSDKGIFTKTPMYYDDLGNLTAEKTGNIAYAYGWIADGSETDNSLYQIPVIKSEQLPYGTYTVEIIPTFTAYFGHSSTDTSGEKYYGFCLDGLRIYNPVNKDQENNYVDPAADPAYGRDQEKFPNYLELKDMLIGADSFGTDRNTQGVIFIDGIPASDNDIEMYKKAGPNNELYLAKGQAVAFEIWATAVPADIQIGIKLVKGFPAATVTNGTYTAQKPILSASEMYYSFNRFMPAEGKLTWESVVGADGQTYYKTQMITIQNTSDSESILSVTNIKWTFADPGNRGVSVEETAAPLRAMPMVSYALAKSAVSSVNMLKADLSVENASESVISEGKAVITLKTSTQVTELMIRDENGNTYIPDNIESIISENEKGYEKLWTVTVKENTPGTYEYYISGVYENGYADENSALTVTVTFEPEKNNEEDNSVLGKLAGFFAKLKEFIYKLLSLFGIVR